MEADPSQLLTSNSSSLQPSLTSNHNHTLSLSLSPPNTLSHTDSTLSPPQLNTQLDLHQFQFQLQQQVQLGLLPEQNYELPPIRASSEISMSEIPTEVSQDQNQTQEEIQSECIPQPEKSEFDNSGRTNEINSSETNSILSESIERDDGSFTKPEQQSQIYSTVPIENSNYSYGQHNFRLMMQGWHQTLQAQIGQMQRLIYLHQLQTGNNSMIEQEEEILPVETSQQDKLDKKKAQLDINQVVDIFTKAFKQNPFPSPEELAQLSSQTGISENQIEHYFTVVVERFLHNEEKFSTEYKPPMMIKKKEDQEIPAATIQISPLEQDLRNMITIEGAVAPEHIPRFVVLLSKETSFNNRSLLLTALKTTTFNPVSTKRFMETEGISILNSWLSDSQEQNKLPIIRSILKILRMLPITLTVLQSTRIGKSVNSLRKHPDLQIKKKALELVDRWKKLLSTVLERASSANASSPGTTSASPKERPPAVPLSSSPAPTPSSSLQKKRVATLQTSPSKLTVFSGLSRKKVRVNPEKELDKDKESIKEVPKKKETLSSAGPLNSSSSDNTTSNSSNNKDFSTVDNRKNEKEVVMNPSKEEGDSQTTSSDKRTPLKKSTLTPDYLLQRSNKKMQLLDQNFSSPLPRTNKAASLPSKPLSADDIRKKKLQDKFNQKEGETRLLSKKRVNWASNLTQIKTFVREKSSDETTESDRNFIQASQQEHAMEKEHLLQNRLQIEKKWLQEIQSMTPATEWKEPPLIEGDISDIPGGKNSEEIHNQQRREDRILRVLYLKEEDIPPSPAEPEDFQEEYDDSITRTIPLYEPIIDPGYMQDGGGAFGFENQEYQNQAPPKLDTNLLAELVQNPLITNLIAKKNPSHRGSNQGNFQHQNTSVPPRNQGVVPRNQPKNQNPRHNNFSDRNNHFRQNKLKQQSW
jgi:hypothetical protein